MSPDWEALAELRRQQTEGILDDEDLTEARAQLQQRLEQRRRELAEDRGARLAAALFWDVDCGCSGDRHHSLCPEGRRLP